MADNLRVGVISSIHGIHGECKIYPTTDDISRFKKLKKVTAVGPTESKELTISGIKFFKNMVICKFDGIDQPEEIAKYRNYDLMIDREDALPLMNNEYYVTDLIDMNVVTDDNIQLGTIKDIFATGANDVMVVSRIDDKDLLIPFIKECILKVDIEAKSVKVHILDGLLDL